LDLDWKEQREILSDSDEETKWLGLNSKQYNHFWEKSMARLRYLFITLTKS
jgi:hypothetical protein